MTGVDEAAPLIARTLGFFVLLFLPALAAAGLLLKRGCRDVVITGLAVLATTGIYGELVFWLWFVSPRIGRFAALIIPVASVILIAVLWGGLDLGARIILRALIIPILLGGAFSTFIIGAGYMYGQDKDDPFDAARSRFSHRLPPDNRIPFLFEEGIWHHNVPKPLLGDWNASDRPPLQTGLVLIGDRFYTKDRKLSSQIMGVLAQGTWIIALWLFLTAFEVDSAVIAWITAACLGSGFILINSFFVWPKLLSAAYTLGAVCLVLAPKARAALAENRWIAALCGVLAALAMLSHGGAIFAFIGAGLIILLTRARIPWRQLAILFTAAFLLYLPWILYQKLYDPPGDRLLKMHLAHVDNPDPRPVSQVVMSAYRAKTPHEIFDLKWENWYAATGYTEQYWTEAGLFLGAEWKHDQALAIARARTLRMYQFFYFLPTLGFVAVGIPTLLFGISRRFRTQLWRTALLLSLFVLATILVWCLLMFGPATTVIHQGNYATVLLGFAACVLALWSVSPRLAQVVIGLQVVSTVVVYGVVIDTQTESRAWIGFGPVHWALFVVALLSLAATTWLLYRMAVRKSTASNYCIAAPASPALREVNTVH